MNEISINKVLYETQFIKILYDLFIDNAIIFLENSGGSFPIIFKNEIKIPFYCEDWLSPNSHFNQIKKICAMILWDLNLN